MARWFKLVFAIIVVFTVIMVGIHEFVRPLLADHFDNLSNYSKAQAVTAYMITSVTLAALAFPGFGMIAAAGGFLFGPFEGTVICLVCMVVGSFGTFTFSRKYLREKILKKYETEVSKVNAGLEKHGLKYFLLLRVSPFPPASVINFAMGVTSVSYFNFIWVSLVGMLPASSLYAYIGSQLASMAQFN